MTLLPSNDYDGPCNFNGINRFLNVEDIVVRENESLPILQKVKSKCNSWIGESASPSKPYGLRGEAPAVADGGVPCWHKQRIGLRMVSPNVVKDPRGDVHTWRVIVPHLISGLIDFSIPHRIFGNTIILASPGQYCTDTYIVLFASTSQSECENFISYLRTKFFRFMLRMRTVSQNITRGCYMWVPDLQNYTKPWTDQELYQRYDLNQEEIKFIESRIKPL